MNRTHRTSRTKTDTIVGLLPDKKIRRPAAGSLTTSFNPLTFLAKVGHGKTTLQASKGQLIFFARGCGRCRVYVQAGRVQLTVLAHRGKKPWSES